MNPICRAQWSRARFLSAWLIAALGAWHFSGETLIKFSSFGAWHQLRQVNAERGGLEEALTAALGQPRRSAPARAAGMEEGPGDEAWTQEEADLAEALRRTEAMLNVVQGREARPLNREEVNLLVKQLTALMRVNSRWVSDAPAGGRGKRFLTLKESEAIQDLLTEARTHWDPLQIQAAMALLVPLRERLRLVQRLQQGCQTFGLAVRHTPTDDLGLALRQASGLLAALFATGAWTGGKGEEAAETLQRLQYLTLGGWLAQGGRIEWLGPAVERIYGVPIEQVIQALNELLPDELRLMLEPVGGAPYGLDRGTAETVTAAAQANVKQGTPGPSPADGVLSVLQKISPGRPAVLAQVIHRLATGRSAVGLEEPKGPRGPEPTEDFLGARRDIWA